MSDKPSLVLVSRLREAYWPRWMFRWASGHALRTRPRDFRPHDWPDRRGYDLGRVHFLLLELLAGKRLKPIEIDTSWHGATPVSVVLLDGHHRFAAAVLAGKRTIPANVGGWLKVRDWLVGERKGNPL